MQIWCLVHSANTWLAGRYYTDAAGNAAECLGTISLSQSSLLWALLESQMLHVPEASGSNIAEKLLWWSAYPLRMCQILNEIALGARSWMPVDEVASICCFLLNSM